MKRKFLFLSIAVMWGCSDYAGQWEDSYGVDFVQSSSTPALICEEGTATTVVNGLCITNFFCSNNAWEVYGDPICSTPAGSSSSKAIPGSSSSVKMSSSSNAGSSSSSVNVSTVFQTWFGPDLISQVDAGLDNGTGASGYWFGLDDHEDGGESKIQWMIEPYPEYDKDSLVSVIEVCGGICGTAVLAQGVLTNNPFAGVAFNVNVQSDGRPIAGDASDWGGICITYSSDLPPRLELGLGDEVDASIGYANPAASLPKSGSGTMKNLAWSDFKQPSWYEGDKKMSGEAASKQLVSVKFLIQGNPGYYTFNICAIGPYNGGCPNSCTALLL